MLKNRVGVNEVEVRVVEIFQALARRGSNESMRDAAKPLSRNSDHFIGYVNTVDLGEQPAERQHQPARPAAYLDSPKPGSGAQTMLHFPFQASNDIRARGMKFPIILRPAAEGDVIVSILTRTAVPVLAHPRTDIYFLLWSLHWFLSI
jgi:hypothetical protein